MDLVKVRYFLKIVDTGSMSRAAEVLNVSASALSKATHLLEEQLGIPLVTTSGRNIVITDAGKVFAKEARKLVRDVEDLKDRLKLSAAPKSQIRLATFEVFSTYFLSALNGLGWEDQSLVLHELLPGEIERAVAEGKVDFGITYQPVPLPEIDLLKIMSIEMGVFTSANAFEGVPQAELPFVVPVEPLWGEATRVKGLDGWPADAYDRKIKYEVTLMESALELVRQGRAAGYFPKFIVAEHNRRYRENLHLARRRSHYGGRVCMTDVFIVKRRNETENSVHKQIAKQIRKICAQ